MAWTLAVAGCGAALACSDPRRAAQAIAREEPPALSLPAEAKPGDPKASNPQPPAPQPTEAPPLAAPPPPDGAAAIEPADGDEGEASAEAKPATRRRAAAHARRRAARDEGAPADPAPATSADLKVLRLVTARNVSGREPVGAASSFSAVDLESIYAFVELANDARAESGIVVTFTPPAGAPHRVKLDVGPQKRWRTWALTRKARAPGKWIVSVTDDRGSVLGQTSFTVTK